MTIGDFDTTARVGFIFVLPFVVRVFVRVGIAPGNSNHRPIDWKYLPLVSPFLPPALRLR